jgi:hypothetical protein
MNASARTLIRFFVLFLFAAPAWAQAGGQRGGPPATPRTQAPFDMTGYWVSVVTEDWRWRMTTPPKGDSLGVPLNARGLQAVKDWDPAKDEAAGQQCKSYGAANIMHVPGRLHITWQDDQTLKIETDSGMQTRLFHFGAANGAGGDWQGVSRAEWELAIPGGYGARAGAGQRFGSLKVSTSKLKSGYLRKNGVPYSENATMTEYYDLINDPHGTYLVLTQNVEDPAYLTSAFPTTVHFRKQADATGWNPQPCTAR